MRCQSLYFLAFFGLAQAKQHLRGQPHSRELELTELVPFDVTMNIKVSEEAKDTQPTTEDYNGAVLGFQNWFEENSVSFYADNSNYDVTYSNTVCQLNQDKTTYTPSAENEIHHGISMSCESTFSADSADDMITGISLAREASKNYPLQDFVPNYIAPASPADSPFHATRAINLQLVPSSSGSGQTPRPTITPTTLAPGDGGDNGGTTKGTMPIILQWTLSVQPDAQDRQPTQEEYENFMADSEAWLGGIFSANLVDTPDGVATFTGVINSHIQASSYDEAAEFPHTITIHSDAEFEKATGEEFPEMMTWVVALRDTGVKVFREDYLAHTTGLFQNPMYLQWRALM